jgi:hypothetical protein
LENKKRKKLAHYRDGAWWVYNTYQDWQNDNFPFWSVATIQRTVSSLEKKGLLKSGRLSETKRDRKKWYTIDYEAVAELELPVSIISNCDDASSQIDTMHDSKLIRCIKEAETNTETTTETMPGALFDSICEICQLNPDDLTKRQRREVLDVERWLREKYSRQKAETLASWLTSFGHWFTNVYWKGKTPQPLWIQEHWQKFRQDVLARHARQAKKAG